jgi:DNA-directed RNA polymerase subunit M/transcription elongation factor TFIIS
MELQDTVLPQHGFYSSCPRCNAVILQVSDHDGSHLCRECGAEDEAVAEFAERALSSAQPVGVR